MSEKLIPANNNVNVHTQAIVGLATQLGYDGDLSVGSLEDGIRLYQKRTIEDLLELGKRLLLLKEQTPHGEFLSRVELLGFDKSVARKLMVATLKFAKMETSPLLKVVNSQSKLLELIVLDDDDIDVIEQGGSIGEVSLDSIDTMSVRDLKKALREAKSTIESKDQDLLAKDQIIGTKDRRNNELLEENTKLKSPVEIKKRAETEEQALEKAALETLSTAGITFLNALMRYQNDVNSVLDTAEKKGISQLFERVDEAVIATYQRIAQYSQSLNVQVDFEKMLTPEWMFPQSADLPPVEVDVEQ
ncbi:hypothetical protein Q7567_08015 [Acinetobacter baumannii]|uniref:hypothetical protein n=1 Tax=Acinetobacter calcoaceticus/baumannii complex TaxID=909768 RepID=UPI0022910D8C|nr:hypothetical protein [Acinetobacter baumannii]HCW5857641.1 hypothetical protein [Acinetobacter baumannii]HCW5872922.1 hypothetical protein [Acinetobacter baumannii]HCW5877110.1 hypothetical protein [Acinetobacter baumannii]HCW5881027.1 hypothetical protein [Acinetobacter baumannii]